MRELDIKTVQSLVGNITPEQMRYVDAYTGKRAAIFVPAAGQCGYSTTKDHSHPSYSFILLTGDPLTVASHHGDSVFYDSNTLITMSPDFKHHEEKVETYVRYYAIMISKELFEEIFKLYDNKKIPYFENHCFNISIDLLPLIKSFMAEFTDKLPGYEKQIHFLEERLTHLIIRNILNVKTSDELISNRIEIEKALEFIGSRFTDKVALEDIARHVNYSPSHFSKLFKKEVGQTVPAYINSLRLKTAKKKLESGVENITEIAYSCGFSSPSHFASSFKSIYKCKPSEYSGMMGKKAKI